MASPVDVSRATTNITTASGSWTVNLPASIQAGDLLIMFTRQAEQFAIANTSPLFTTNFDDVSDASNDVTSFSYRWADGTEGATMTVTIANVSKGAAIVYRITGAENPATQAPETQLAVGTGANVDPPSITPSGGSNDYLILVFAALDGETQTFTVPTNYANLAQANSGTGGAAATNCRVASASRQVTAASENPGVFTNAAPSNGWTGITVAIHPAAAAAPGPVWRRRPAHRFLTIR